MQGIDGVNLIIFKGLLEDRLVDWSIPEQIQVRVDRGRLGAVSSQFGADKYRLKQIAACTSFNILKVNMP